MIGLVQHAIRATYMAECRCGAQIVFEVQLATVNDGTAAAQENLRYRGWRVVAPTVVECPGCVARRKRVIEHAVVAPTVVECGSPLSRG